MAQYYEVLGLDAPPKDRREVKKAYSKQLKLTRPEDDPEGFMLLRDAHDQALNVIAWEAQQETIPEVQEAPPEAETQASLTFADMIEEAAPSNDQAIDETIESPTSYAIGAVPSLDAPVQRRAAPPPPPLNQDILAVLESRESRNNRENWNLLFQKARQLDIDDYVDFEALLLQHILELHGFYDENNPHINEPEKLPTLLGPSITASLFKTMQWDQVSNLNTQQVYWIEWLERRMGVRSNRPAQQSFVPQNSETMPNNLAKWFWPALGGLFALAFLFDFIAG